MQLEDYLTRRHRPYRTVGMVLDNDAGPKVFIPDPTESPLSHRRS